MIFVGEMYGVQADQLACLLAATERRVSALIRRWQAAGSAQAAALGPGPRWVWLTKDGLTRCGLRYTAGVPGLSGLAHLRAVTAARLALAAAPQFAAGAGHWRSERSIRASIGGTAGLRGHVPDGQLLWPDGTPVAWAGECWAIEAELTPKTLARTVAIMRDLLTRTGDYGCRAADVLVPGAPALHSRALYLCSPTARPVVTRARNSLGHLGGRVEIRLLPDGALLAVPATSPVRAGRDGGAGPGTGS